MIEQLKGWAYWLYDWMFPFGFIEVPLRLRDKMYLRDHVVTMLELGVFCFLCYYAQFKVTDVGKIKQ